MNMPMKLEETPVVHQGPLMNEANSSVAQDSKGGILPAGDRLLGSHEKILAF
jgi:hypothetical protein